VRPLSLVKHTNTDHTSLVPSPAHNQSGNETVLLALEDLTLTPVQLFSYCPPRAVQCTLTFAASAPACCPPALPDTAPAA